MIDAREWVDRQRINTLGVCLFVFGFVFRLFVLILLWEISYKTKGERQ